MTSNKNTPVGETGALTGYKNCITELSDQREALVALVSSTANMIVSRATGIGCIDRKDFFSEPGRVIWDAIAVAAKKQVEDGYGMKVLDGVKLLATYRAMDEFDDGGPITHLFNDIRGAEHGYTAAGQLDSALYPLVRNRVYRAAHSLGQSLIDAASLGNCQAIITASNNAWHLLSLVSRARNHPGAPGVSGGVV